MRKNTKNRKGIADFVLFCAVFGAWVGGIYVGDRVGDWLFPPGDVQENWDAYPSNGWDNSNDELEPTSTKG